MSWPWLARWFGRLLRGPGMGETRRPVLGVDFHVWDGIFQGSRSHLLGLYRAAIRQAPDIDFVFFLDGVDSLRSSFAEFASPNVRLVRMRHAHPLWRLGAQLPWLQVRHRIQLLHMQYRLPFVRFGPCACTIHDLLFETHPEFFPASFVLQSKVTFRSAALRARVLFAVSHFSRAEIERLYGVPAGRTVVVYNGVDRARFSPGSDGLSHVVDLGLEPGGYLLTVGRLEPRKNHLTLVEAYARLPATTPPLVIVGQRDFGFDGVFEAIRRLGLGQRVKVLERVGDDALPAVLRHASIFVYPAFAEGFGMPVAEAMASGVPVITSNTTSLPEVAGDGALTVDPNSVEGLARAMADLLSNDALRQRLIAAGHEQVRRFDWETSASTMLAAMRADFAGRGA